ncbi:hypothetical protein [Streptomyces sp. JB150]|uniref:hypothetical protein n=1 Tax=Streptomyces sp. JB150 TaxID=2714844 RepID=UPI00140B2AC9|nr:hypothetical protein [Streptomyces sp. JB150]QIJ63144.1 hypothetical protein G7Z13_14700 [Streptomyces sp. JB150]
MHGHGYVQPVKQPPPTAWLVVLRVLFVAISILSLGFLTWSMLLRLAIVTRKSLDWGLFVAVLAVDVLAVVLLGTEPGEEIHTAGGWTGLALLLGTLVIVIAYYLAADIRHFHQLRYGPYAPRPEQAYGYPRPAAPYTAVPGPATTGTTVPQTPPVSPLPQPRLHPQPPSSLPHTPPPSPAPVSGVPVPPAHTPPPQRPAPARIDQVRAELDELSELLRRQDGEHEGGR